jgi:hypothetical protein
VTAPVAVPAGTLADCCADRGNRVLATPTDPAHPERVHEQCGVCGRNHYRVRLAVAEALGLIQRP